MSGPYILIIAIIAVLLVALVVTIVYVNRQTNQIVATNTDLIESQMALLEKNRVQEHALTNQKEQLASQEEQLASQKEQLTSQKEQLTSQKELLTSQKELLTSQKELLSNQEEKLASQKELLANQKEQLSSQEEKLASQQERLADQAERIKEQQQQTDSLQKELEVLKEQVREKSRIERLQEQVRHRSIAIKKTNEMTDDELLLWLDQQMDETLMFCEQRLTLKETAARLGLTQKRIQQAIKSQDKYKNLTEYLNEKRFLYACQLLRNEPRWTIEAIAKEAGFANRLMLHEMMRSRLGLTPREFRQMPQ